MEMSGRNIALVALAGLVGYVVLSKAIKPLGPPEFSKLNAVYQ